MQTIFKKAWNCLYEEITFEISHNFEKVCSVIGKVADSRQIRFLISWFVTNIRYPNAEKSTGDSAGKLAYTGYGRFTRFGSAVKFTERIQYTMLQADFVLGEKEITLCKNLKL